MGHRLTLPLCQRRSAALTYASPTALLRFAEIAFDSPEPVLCQLHHPVDYTAIVIAERQDVVQRREAGRLPLLLHLLQLLRIELVVLNRSPVIAGRVHREAWRQCAID